MSFSSHWRKLLDESEPLEHRASHARSCAIHVANKLGLKRDEVIELVAAACPERARSPDSEEGSVEEITRQLSVATSAQVASNSHWPVLSYSTRCYPQMVLATNDETPSVDRMTDSDSGENMEAGLTTQVLMYVSLLLDSHR